MAAHRTEIDYLRAAVLGDQVWVGTWIVNTDEKLRVERRFQVRRASDGETLARARTDYVCINLDSGRAARMPESFSLAYVLKQPGLMSRNSHARARRNRLTIASRMIAPSSETPSPATLKSA